MAREPAAQDGAGFCLSYEHVQWLGEPSAADGKAKTGLSQAVVVFAIVAVIAAVAASAFFVFAAFIWLAERYSPLTAALVLALASC